jgi:hypothetical protein
MKLLKGRSSRFPSKLYEMVENAESQGYDHIVSWIIDDKGNHGFVLHDTDLLSEQVLGKYFESSSFRTFQRQLSYWSFKRLAGVYSQKNLKVTYGHSSGLFRKGDKTLVDNITRRETKRSCTRKQGISINLKHFATEADYAVQALETAEGMALEYMRGVCVTNESKESPASSSMKDAAAAQPHADLLLVEDHSNTTIPQQELEVEHARYADVVSLDEKKCTAAELFDEEEQEEDGGGGAKNSNYVSTNESTSSNYFDATGCHRGVSTASPTSSMPSSDDDEQSSSSSYHVQQPVAYFENRPAIHQASAACWPQQLGQTETSFEESQTFLSSLQKQVEDFMRKSSSSAHQQHPTTSTRQPRTEDKQTRCREEKDPPAAAVTMALNHKLNHVYCSLQQAECELLSGLRYMESRRSGNARIERETLPAAAAPRLFHHQGPPRPPPQQGPTKIHVPASIHGYQQQQRSRENFTGCPSLATCGEQELKPLSAEEDNDDYSTTTRQAVPAAVLLYMLNSGNARTRMEAV